MAKGMDKRKRDEKKPKKTDAKPAKVITVASGRDPVGSAVAKAGKKD